MIVGLIDERRSNAVYCQAHHCRRSTVTDYAGFCMDIRLELAAWAECLVVKILILGN